MRFSLAILSRIGYGICKESNFRGIKIAIFRGLYLQGQRTQVASKQYNKLKAKMKGVSYENAS